MTERIIADEKGLSTHLWEKYITNIIDDALDAWAEFDKIVDPQLFKPLNSLGADAFKVRSMHSS